MAAKNGSRGRGIYVHYGKHGYKIDIPAHTILFIGKKTKTAYDSHC